MDAIQHLSEINFSVLVVSLFMMLSAIIAGYKIITEFLAIIGKPVGVIKQRKEDHALLLQTTKNLSELQKRHEADTAHAIEHDEVIRNEIKKLKAIIVDKEINDYRWEIINLADKISNGKSVSKECYRHALSTYEKYEKVIADNGKTNGEVEISIKIIRDSYQEKLKEGF